MIRESYAADLDRQINELDRRHQLENVSTVQRAKLHYKTEQQLWENGQPFVNQNMSQQTYAPANYPGHKLMGQPSQYNPQTILRS